MSFISGSTATNGYGSVSNTNISVTMPAACAAGDVVLAMVSVSTTANISSVSSSHISWSLVRTFDHTANTQNFELWRGKVTSGFSASTESITATWSTSAYYGHIDVIAYTPDAGYAFATEPVQQQGEDTYAAASNPTSADGYSEVLVTTGTGKFDIVGLLLAEDNSGTGTTNLDPGTGMTLRGTVHSMFGLSDGTNPFLWMDKAQASAGSTTVYGTFSESSDYMSSLVAVALEMQATGGPAKVIFPEVKTSGTSWTAPATVTSVKVEAWGAGGGGGGNTQASRDGGGGGGGGAYARDDADTVTPGNSYSYSLGTGGGGGTNGAGSAGGDTTWRTTVVVAKGGQGGSAGASSAGGQGGTPGTAAASTGDQCYDGGYGEDGRTSTTGRGGWGGSSGGSGAGGYYVGSSPTYTGTAPFTNSYPTGNTPSGGGHGGNGAGVTSGGGSAPAAGQYGGGGGGASEGTTVTGGSGAGGKIILTYEFSALSTETDTALACTVENLTDTQEISTGRADETDKAQTRFVFPGKALETDKAQTTYLLAFRSGETDSAQTLSSIKVRSTQYAEETDTALTVPLSLHIGVAEETDTAETLGRVRIYSAGISEETDSSLALTATRIYATGIAEETDSASALTAGRVYTVGVAGETDASLALARLQAGFYIPFGMKIGLVPGGITVVWAEETDTAYDLGRVKFRLAGMAEETDLAIKVPLSARIEFAEETDSSLGLGRTKLRTYSQADETDSAQPLVAIKARSTGIAEETDSASSLSRTKIRSVDLASETDTAFELTQAAQIFVGVANETDSALTLTRKRIYSYSYASETDTSYGLQRVTFRAVGYSSETDTAEFLARTKLYAAGYGTETDSAQSLGRVKLRAIAYATSVNTAEAPSVGIAGQTPGFYLPLRFTFGAAFTTVSIGTATEADSAFNLARTKFRVVGLATGTNTAVALGLGEGLPGFYFPLRYLVGVSGAGQYLLTGLTVESDTSFSLSFVRNPTRLMIRWAEETPIAYSQVFTKFRSVGVANEVDSARQVGRSYAVKVAEETDTAITLSLGFVGNIGTAVEVDTAHYLVYRKIIHVQVAESLNEALAMVAPAAISVGIAEETDLAFGAVVSELYNIGTAVEVDTALAPIVRTTNVVGIAYGYNAAIRVPYRRVTSTKVAQSFNTAYLLRPTTIRPMGRGTEVDTAYARRLFSNPAREYDVARFFTIKQNGQIVYPVVPTTSGRRMWTRFVA